MRWVPTQMAHARCGRSIGDILRGLEDDTSPLGIEELWPRELVFDVERKS